MVQAFVSKNNGSAEDAADLFHDALVVIFEKSQKNTFAISCRFSTYLYAVCRNLWLKKLRQRKNMPLEASQHVPEQPFIEEAPGLYTDTEAQKKKIFQRCFAKLSEACQNILSLSMEGRSVDDISSEMGHSSKQHTLNRKYRCKETLKKLVKQDPDYPDLYA